MIMIRKRIPFMMLLVILFSVFCIPPKTVNAATYIKKTMTTTFEGCSANSSTIQVLRQLDGVWGAKAYGYPNDYPAYTPSQCKNGVTINWQNKNDTSPTSASGTFYITWTDTGNGIGKWTVKMTNVDCKNVTPYIEVKVGTKPGYTSTIAGIERYTGTEYNSTISTDGTFNAKQESPTQEDNTTFLQYFGGKSDYKKITYSWTPHTYTVRYNGNGNTSGSMSNSSHTYDVAKNLSANGFSKTGHNFGGWATSQSNANNKIKKYNDGQSVLNLTTTNGGVVDLYAIWNPKEYTVTYNANKGTGTMSNSTIKYEKDFLTKQNVFSRDGFHFTGWNENPKGTGTAWTLKSKGVYEYGQPWKWTYTNNITLYAQWDANTYSITYEAPGAISGVPPKQSFLYTNERGDKISSMKPQYNGYTF